MSLIVTSSEQADSYGRKGDSRTRTRLGIEEYAKYQNHFTVPVEIPADAEIAVESVKIRRGALYDIENNALLYRYFGRLQNNASGVALEDCNGMPCPIRPDAGTYTIEGWADELQKQFQNAYQSPWTFKQSIVNTVKNASGASVGLSYSENQRPQADVVDISASMTGGAALAGEYFVNPHHLGKNNPFHPGLNIFGQIWLRTVGTTADPIAGFNPAWDYQMNDGFGRTQFAGAPLGHRWVMEFANCSLSGRIGLSRPQQEYMRGNQIMNMLPGVPSRTSGFASLGNDMYKLIDRYGDDQEDYYDYGLEFDKTGRMFVFQTLYNAETNMFEKRDVDYGNASNPVFNTGNVTHTALLAVYDRFMWKIEGDEVSLWWVPTGSPVGMAVAMVHSSISPLPNRCFAPIGETRNALYPKATVGIENAFWGDLLMYESHYTVPPWHVGGVTYPKRHTDQDTFRFPYWDNNASALQTGDDFYSNNRVPKTGPANTRVILEGGTRMPTVVDTKARPWGKNQTVIADTKAVYSAWQNNENASFTFQSASNHQWAYNVGPDARSFENQLTDSDYLEGVYATDRKQHTGNISRQLGFGDESYMPSLNQDGSLPAYITLGGAGLNIIFNSISPLEFKSHPAFVRLPTLTHKSYNGAKSSVSKIVYQVPRFDNTGRMIGDLYFAPHEKTYVRLHNTEPFLLNNLDVQIVDVNETPAKDLEGPTVVVLHSRKYSGK
tara:strand:+ start:146 stop:2308 length:2163 start_codon:yes stop_codon:yes gene_type:complete